MKLHEVLSSVDADDAVLVKSGADIMKALKASLMHDWLIVDIEADHNTEYEKYRKPLQNLCRTIAGRRPVNGGSGLMSCTVFNSEDLKKLLDGMHAMFGDGKWLWTAAVTNWDFDK